MGVLEEVEKFKQQQAGNGQQVTKAEAPENTPAPVPQTATAEDNVLHSAIVGAMTERAKTPGELPEVAKDLTYLKGTGDLQNDTQFQDRYREELAKQLVQDLKDKGELASLGQDVNKQRARNERSLQFYEGCKPIFELLGINAPFGLVPMIVTIVLLMIPFLVVSFVRFVFNSMNSIFLAIAGFRKPAFYLCSIILTVVITGALILGLIWCIDMVFGTQMMAGARDAMGGA